MSRIIKLVISCVGSITSILIPVIVAGYLFAFINGMTTFSSDSFYVFDLNKFTEVMSAFNPGYSFKIAFDSAKASMFWLEWFNDAIDWLSSWIGSNGISQFLFTIVNLGNFGVTVAFAIIPISVFATSFLVDIINGIQFILTCIASPSLFFTDAASWVVY